MDAFVTKHAHAIRGVLSCFERVLFRGYVPLMSGYAMAECLQRQQVRRHTLKAFLLRQVERGARHARALATDSRRPYQYLTGPTRKEHLARQIAERDGISEGLGCVFSVLEPCRTFSLVWKEAHPYVKPAWRKCLHRYFYFLDRQLGLIPVKLQTWVPFPLQVYVNGPAGLAHRLDRHGVRYDKRDNVFVQVGDIERAQHLADGFASVDWVRVLGRYARQVNPLLRDRLAPMQYYWGTAQAESSTDVLLRRPQALEHLMPRRLTYRTLYFEAREVMAFLGRKVHGNFQGDVVTDQVDFHPPLSRAERTPGRGQ